MRGKELQITRVSRESRAIVGVLRSVSIFSEIPFADIEKRNKIYYDFSTCTNFAIYLILYYHFSLVTRECINNTSVTRSNRGKDPDTIFI